MGLTENGKFHLFTANGNLKRKFVFVPDTTSYIRG